MSSVTVWWVDISLRGFTRGQTGLNAEFMTTMKFCGLKLFASATKAHKSPFSIKTTIFGVPCPPKRELARQSEYYVSD